MGIYKTYFSKNNTIIKNSEVNTGNNPVSELYYGSNVSRFLFYIDFTTLKEKYNNKEIIINSTKHFLKIKATSNFDVAPYLNDNNNNLMMGDKFRSSSFDLEVKPILEFWDEGRGYDFELNQLSKPQNNNYCIETSNWYRGTNSKDFTFSGGMLGNSIGTQHFDKGNEDVYIDITTYVNDILTGGTDSSDYNGFCLKYIEELEDSSILFNTHKLYAFGLFTRHTQTFFEPYIETIYDDLIRDDRVDFFLNKSNRLYLYVNVDGKLTNLDELPICTITGDTFTGRTETVYQQSKGIYYVEFLAEYDYLGNGFDTFKEYKDIWSNIKINSRTLPNKILKFFPKEEQDYYQIGNDILSPVKYGISLSGINREEKIQQGEIKRISVHLRKPYTIEQYDIVTHIFYKMYIKQGENQIIVIDWQEVNKIFNSNSFVIDSTWLIPQNYYVDLKIERNGEVNIYNEELNFKIINKI